MNQYNQNTAPTAPAPAPPAINRGGQPQIQNPDDVEVYLNGLTTEQLAALMNAK